MAEKYGSGRALLLGHGIPQAVPITLNPAAYAGALVYGTDGRLYQSDGTAWVLNIGRQLYNTTIPNLAQPVLLVQPDSAQRPEANIDIAILPRGQGAIIAGVPDFTDVGGNKRGQYAVDLQMLRGAASAVASGNGAVIAGGDNNTASGVRSVISGGSGNTASGEFSVVAGGRDATTRGLYGRSSFASGQFSLLGDAQYGLHTLRRGTTNATASGLGADGAAPSSTNIPILPNNSLYTFRIRVSCIQTGGTAGAARDCKAWDVVGAIKRGANAAATALLGTPTITVVGADTNLGADNTTGAIIAIAANTSLGGLVINVTGQANKNLQWVATVETTEVTY